MSNILSSKLVLLLLSALLSGGQSSFFPESDGENPAGVIVQPPITSELAILNKEATFHESPAKSIEAPSQKPDLTNSEVNKKTESVAQTTDVKKSPNLEVDSVFDPVSAIVESIVISEQVANTNLPENNPAPTALAIITVDDKKKNDGDKTASTFTNESEKPNVPAAVVKQVSETEKVHSNSKVIEATSTAQPATTERVSTTTESEQVEKLEDTNPLLVDNIFIPLVPVSKPSHKKPKTKCDGVTCTAPNFSDDCEITKADIPTKADSSNEQLSSCCPIWFCSRADGSVYTHYGLTRLPKRRQNKQARRNKLKKHSRYQKWGRQQEFPLLGEDYFDLPPVMNKLSRQVPERQERVNSDQDVVSHYQIRKPSKSFSQFNQRVQSSPQFIQFVPNSMPNYNNAPRRTLSARASQYPGNRYVSAIPLAPRSIPFTGRKFSSKMDFTIDFPFNSKRQKYFRQRKPKVIKQQTIIISEPMPFGKSPINQKGIPVQMPFLIPFLSKNADLSDEVSDSAVMLDYPQKSQGQQNNQKSQQTEQSLEKNLKIQNKLTETMFSELDKEVDKIIEIISQSKADTTDITAQRKVAPSSVGSPIIVFSSMIPISDPALHEKPAASISKQGNVLDLNSVKASENAIEDIQERNARRARFAPPYYRQPMQNPYIF